MLPLLFLLSIGVPAESRTKPYEPVIIEHEEGSQYFESKQDAEEYIKEFSGYLVKDPVRAGYLVMFRKKGK